MTEHELELRLQAAARALDADAPAFDPARLCRAPRRRLRTTAVALVAVAALGFAVAPGAISGLRSLFGVDEVTELGPVLHGVAAPFEGRPVSSEAVAEFSPFRVRQISSLGSRDAAYVRDDVAGGMVTIRYGQILLTQWREADVDARITIVPASGVAEEAEVGRLPGLWIEGTARGTFTLIGADGTIHRERFDVGAGVLLWKAGGMAFLLQGAGPRDEAASIAARVDP
jgi:hypothetical protein